jgi:phage portal protein BeeE
MAGILDRLRGREAAPEARDSLENPSVSLYTALIGTTDATLDSATGASVTPERAVRVVAFLACLKLLAETIASLPIGVFERDEKGLESSCPTILEPICSSASRIPI